MKIGPLDDGHDRSAFASGFEPLDRYFRMQAGHDVSKSMSPCFVLTEGAKNPPIGFYTLTWTSIALADVPREFSKRLPGYPAIPATLMARLAVDGAHRRRGLGRLMLLDAFSRTLRSDVAAFAFIVDATGDAAANFYMANSFLPLAADGSRLFLPMAEIAKLFA